LIGNGCKACKYGLCSLSFFIGIIIEIVDFKKFTKKFTKKLPKAYLCLHLHWNKSATDSVLAVGPFSATLDLNRTY